MFTKRRYSRPVSVNNRASYTGVSSQSNAPAPTSGALAAASVIGKALKENNHKADGLNLKLPQQPPKNSQAHRNSSLLGANRNSPYVRANSINSSSARRVSSRAGSIRSHQGPSPMSGRNNSINSQSRSIGPATPQQRRAVSSSGYPQQTSPTHSQQYQNQYHQHPQRRSSLRSNSSVYRPQSMPPLPITGSNPKTIKKWIPSANGLICVEVPAGQQNLGSRSHSTNAQRAIARSSSLNSLSTQSRKKVLVRSSSLTGAKPAGLHQQQQPQQRRLYPQQQKQRPLSQQHPPHPQYHYQQPQQLQSQNSGGSMNSAHSLGHGNPRSPIKPPNRQLFPSNGSPSRTSLKQKASLQSMHTQGGQHANMSFEPTILEGDEANDNSNINENNDISATDLENLKAEYLAELETERLQEEQIEQERRKNEALETEERERAFSLASGASKQSEPVGRITVKSPTNSESVYLSGQRQDADIVEQMSVDSKKPEGKLIEPSLPLTQEQKEGKSADGKENGETEYSDADRLLAEQRLEELVKQKELEILAEVRRQKQLQLAAMDGSGNGITSSLVSVTSSQYPESTSKPAEHGADDAESVTLDEEATANSSNIDDSEVVRPPLSVDASASTHFEDAASSLTGAHTTGDSALGESPFKPKAIEEPHTPMRRSSTEGNICFEYFITRWSYYA
ncbi:unnamed protein product [Ambrosiozyma monospora]|uniref:Unnamed protein product n=1 Tax=Ambrosiozyma monospora TaxID=43982 RepID=A0ACB5SZ72_AMBMO|nr:unnamed protein product [Ambrosiozyma monospora]